MDNQDFIIKNDILLLYLGAEQDVVVPDNVIEIDKNAFKQNKNIKSVRFPSKLKKIPPFFFKGFKALEEVFIPEGVIQIGSNAFCDCENLKTVTLPKSLAKIGSHAFEGCLSLREIIIPDGVSEIGAFAFRWCDVAKVTLPATLKKIPDALFYSCRCLCSIVIPDTVEEIGAEAFCGTRLETITIPNNVTEIKKGALSSCGFSGNLFEKVKLPERQTIIVPYMFESCEWVTEVVIPSHIKKIAENAFSLCCNLKKLVISDGVETIGAKAFGECRGLTEVVIPYSVTSVSADAFGTTAYYDRLGLVNGHSFGCKNIKNLTVPTHIFSKGFFKFNWCDRLYAHEGIALIRTSKYMHFFEATLQAVQKGVDTLKALGEDNLTIYAPSGSVAATYALDNEIDYIETPKANLLQIIYKKDAVDKLESWLKRYHIPKELFDIVYMDTAKALKAKKCTEFLKNWKAENL